MSTGLDIAGVVLAGINIAHLAVIAYQEARPGRTAASLHRKLNNEKAIYEQFLNRFLASCMPSSEITKYLNNPEENPLNLKDKQLGEKMRRRLGNKTFELVIDSLGEMDVLLKALGSELKNMSEGSKTLAKITTKVRVRIATRPMSSVQRNLAQITEINKELRRLVNGSGSMVRSRSRVARQKAKIRFLHREYREPEEIYQTICSVFACDCDEPHIANIGCQCPSCHYPLRMDNTSSSHHKWTIELVLLPTNGSSTDGSAMSENAVECLDSPVSPTEPACHEMQRSLSVRLDEPPASVRDSPTEPIEDLCSVINADTSLKSSMGSLGIMGRAKQYDLKLVGHKSDGGKDGHIVTLADLINIDTQGLTRRQRMQIAFQLCVSVLQLHRTHWVNDGWSWEDSCALRLVEEQLSADSDDPDEDDEQEFPHLFITQRFYSHGQVHEVRPSKPCTTPLGILTMDPVLAKLGFALIVLAVNKTLAEIRREKGFADFPMNTHEDLNDYLTAKKLLSTSRIRDEAGVAYEDVVRACIEGQYLDLDDATTRRFRNRDADDFYDDAEEAIMHPLFTYCQMFA